MAYPPITTYVDRASFNIWSKDDIKKISVKKVTEPKSFEKLGIINQDGLYSNALGPIKRFENCTTCGLSDMHCPGHYGHIELSVPVYHPMLIQTMFQILNKTCLECHHFRLAPQELNLFLAQLEALNNGFEHLVDDLDLIAKDICRGEKSNDNYVSVLLKDKLQRMIEEEKEKTLNFDCQKRPQQRSIVERVSKIFRNFINGQLIKPSKLCPKCGEKKTSISLHQQSVIVLGSGASKPITDINNVPRGKIQSATKRKRPKLDKAKKANCDDIRYLKTDEKKFMTPIGARYVLRQLWKNEKSTMKRIFHFLNIPEPENERKEKKLTDDDDNDNLEEDDDGPKTKLKLENKFQAIDLFFIDTVLVPPAKFRPPMSQRGFSFEGPRTAALSNVMKQSQIVRDCIEQWVNESDEVEAEILQPKLQAHWKDLQISVNCLFDNEMDKYGKNKYPGLKQLIDKKEGLFRKNMMGKRVNFAARSVISPDPNISVDQVGVPLVFAKKLTYPQPVTPWNIQQLREAVLNGPDKYPGALSIIFDDGVTVSLTKESVRQNIASRLSYNHRHVSRFQKNQADTPMVTIVNRHLLTGDVLLFNRQPTLHKPSIMAFKARVLPNEKGFRLHYANCKSFNADFDGDEMNAHLPQSELARSEAYNIASVNHQYLVPKDGSPLGGLIQDHVVAVCILTRRDQLLDKAKYYQLVFCALSFLDKQIKLEPPTIIKPEPIWTGKQVITTIIRNCTPQGRLPPTLKIKSKIGPKILNISAKYEQLSDCHVYIKNGELLTGFMDKSNVGATQYGLIHTCYELYGGETSSNMMSAFARLSTWYLQLYEGFTLGIADILIEDDADRDRTRLIENSRFVGPDSAKEALSITADILGDVLEDKLREAHSDRDPLPMKKLDAAMKKRTDKFSSDISARCLPDGLIRRFPDNNLQMMIQSGAKGGTVNALQISCLLGQIELEGRRVPLSMSGRSLPSFKPYDTSPKAGGFVSGRFLTGIQPQEFFFHCMAGREGLIDTAVKTSRSGYLQRCLIKHLEGLTVHYDQTVRDSCGSVIQFLYGEDGLDIVKCQMLKDKAFPLLVDNNKIIGPSEDELNRLNKAKEAYEEDVIARSEEIQQWLEVNGENRVRKLRGSGFLDFQAAMLNEQVAPSDNQSSELREPVVGEQTSMEELGSIKIKQEKPDNQVAIKTEMVGEADLSIGDEIEKSADSDDDVIFCSQITKQRKDEIREAWYKLSFKEKRKWNKYWDSCPDPLTAFLNPGAHFGVVPEKLDEKIESFVRKNPQLIVNPATMIGVEGVADQTLDSFINCEVNPELSKTLINLWNNMPGFHMKPQMTKHEFYNLCYNLYIKMLAQPGEAVGLLAAQSIGEPSTQMTLNTFHFAGRGEMNVTLGIPRLREILMTASAKIGTPSMDLPLLPVLRDEYGRELSAEETEYEAQRVKLALNAVRLSDVLEYVDITEQLVNDSAEREAAFDGGRKSFGAGRKRSKKAAAAAVAATKHKSIDYKIHFQLLPTRYYKHEYRTRTNRVLKFIEEEFIGQLVDAMLKRSKRLLVAENIFDLATKRMSKTDGSNKKSAGPDVDGGGEDVEERELDDYNAKQRAKDKMKDDESSSDDDEDGEGDNTAQRLKSRRNPELDYEEAEAEDLEVADLDAKAAELEEGDQELLVDDGDADEHQQLLVEANEVSNDSVQRNYGGAADDDGQDGEQGMDSIGNGELTLPANEEEEEGEEDNDHETLRNKRAAAGKLKAQEPDADRINRVMGNAYVHSYEYDLRDSPRWCRVTIRFGLQTTRLDMGALIESEAKRTYVHRVGSIQRALIVKDVGARERGAKCDKMIKTEGVSLLSLVKFNHILDLNAVYSNDIHAIARTYGIEAASQAIRREMANVFAVYGIEVDSRHLSLIADYMTYNGSIRGMNRMTMEASASPFQQMSFESTIRYLKFAAILGLSDDIQSPSAALVFGRPTRGGTGQFTTLVDSAPIMQQQPAGGCKRGQRDGGQQASRRGRGAASQQGLRLWPSRAVDESQEQSSEQQPVQEEESWG